MEEDGPSRSERAPVSESRVAVARSFWGACDRRFRVLRVRVFRQDLRREVRSTARAGCLYGRPCGLGRRGCGRGDDIARG